MTGRSLPGRLLGGSSGRVAGSGPVTGGSGASGSPLVTSTVPVGTSLGTGEAGSLGIPVAGGGEAGLNGGNTLLLNAGELLLLDLLLGLSLGVAVYYAC